MAIPIQTPFPAVGETIKIGIFTEFIGGFRIGLGEEREAIPARFSTGIAKERFGRVSRRHPISDRKLQGRSAD
jgi:hypothetical protein